MPVRVLDQGTYELFETIHRHRILVLNGKRWYAWVRGQRGDLIVRSDSNHVMRRTLQLGRFYYVDFKDDPKFKDMPHLFLQRADRYREFLLPDGFPTRNDPQKLFVATRHTIAREELEQYLQHPAPAGPGEERLRQLRQMRRRRSRSTAATAATRAKTTRTTRTVKAVRSRRRGRAAE
jgi:hypothetical protein